MRLDVSDPGIVAISRWIFNCYVVRDGGAGRPFVVDAGLPANASDAVRFITHELDGTPGDIAFLTVTHGHTDHLGGAPSFIEATGAPLYLPARDADYLGGERPRSPGPRAMLRIAPVLRDQPFEASALAEFIKGARRAGFDGTGAMKCPSPVAGYLKDGDLLPNAPDWVVVSTPGHTDDSTSYYNEATSTLLSGDAVLTCRGRAWFNPEFVDRDRSQRTAGRLREFRVDHLFPGHGRPLHGEDLLSRAASSTERPG
ncbi:MAG: MBL fold metallo-hydrolase [Actinomycetes bacterium]